MRVVWIVLTFSIWIITLALWLLFAPLFRLMVECAHRGFPHKPSARWNAWGIFVKDGTRI